MKSQRITFLTRTAILSAISVILYLVVKFPIPFIFPGFLDVQFSNLPAIIAGFLMGPFSGMVVVLVRFIIKLPLSSTACVGELADLIIGLVVVITTAVIYQRNHTKKGAIIALSVGTGAWVITSLLLNWLILAPFYIEFYFNGNVAGLVGMLSYIPGVNAQNYMLFYLFVAIVPFNLIISSLNVLITFFVYKKIGFMFKQIEENKEHIEVDQKYQIKRKMDFALLFALLGGLVTFLLYFRNSIAGEVKSLSSYISDYFFDFKANWSGMQIFIVILTVILLVGAIYSIFYLIKKKQSPVLPLLVLLLYALVMGISYYSGSISNDFALIGKGQIGVLDGFLAIFAFIYTILLMAYVIILMVVEVLHLIRSFKKLKKTDIEVLN